jgi:hypothetical protein
VASLNEIPEHLRDHRYDRDWSWQQGFLGGLFWTLVVAGAILPCSMCVAYDVPVAFLHWALSAVAMFLITALLHGVMHSTSGFVSPLGNVVAIVAAVAILIVTHLAFLFGIAARATPPVSGWSLFTLGGLVWGNVTAWIGIALAGVVCRDGDFTFGCFLDLLMRNAMTFRR